MTYRKIILGLIVVMIAAGVGAAVYRVVRVRNAASAIPTYPGAREGGGRVRYFPRILSLDDRSSARVQRLFAIPESTRLGAIGRYVDSVLVPQGWYLVTIDELERVSDPQVLVWQRDPDERVDLTQLWPVDNMTRTQRLYGGFFPPDFLD